MKLNSPFPYVLAVVLGIAAVLIWMVTQRDPGPEAPNPAPSAQNGSKTNRPGAPASAASRTDRPARQSDRTGSTVFDPDAPAKAVEGVVSGNHELLRQGIAADPRNPHLLYLGATHSGFPENERLALSERFYEAAPNNALAAFIHASHLMKADDPEAAIEVLGSAANRSTVSDYFALTEPLSDAAFGGVGTYTPSEAKLVSLSSLQRSYLAGMRTLVTSLAEQANSLSQSEGNEIRALAASMGARLEEHTSSGMMADHRAGIALAQAALEGLPANAPSPYSEMTVEQARTSLADELAELQQVEAMRLSMDELLSQDPLVIDSYVSRLRADGEMEATKWLRERMKENPPAPDGNGGS